MGYEIKMYIVEPASSINTSKFVEDGGDWFHCWQDNTAIDIRPYHYSYGGKTKTYVDYSNKTVIRRYCSVIAMVDLCKVGVTSFPNKDTDYYFYGTDGNTPIIKDKYGDFLQEASLDSVIEWLEKAVQKSEYRRLKTALALAKGCVDLYDNPTVLLYGY